MSQKTTFKLLLMGLCLTACLSATPVTWYVNGAFDDGGTIGGSFVFDANANVYSSVAVTTSTGAVLTGANYVLPDPCCTQAANFLLFVTTTGNLTGTPVLSVYLVNPMTDSGGTIALATASSGLPFFSEESCADATCTGPAGTTRFVVSGAVSSAPEPASFLLVLPFCALIALRRRAWSV